MSFNSITRDLEMTSQMKWSTINILKAKNVDVEYQPWFIGTSLWADKLVSSMNISKANQTENFYIKIAAGPSLQQKRIWLVAQDDDDLEERF